MDFSSLLNDKQIEAVMHTEGPLLIIAGAGSGKTRVLTYRISYLINEKKINPWNIMAITFTNKAANEMRDRVNAIVGSGAEEVWVSTFHSSCARILRRYIDRIGYSNSFSIYDADDSRAVIKDVISEMNVDIKRFPPKRMQYIISSSKNKMYTSEEMLNDASGHDDKIIASIYEEYEKKLFKNNALDFDDLLIKTVELFKKAPEVLYNYQNRFRYIMVDEYQDTNKIQFEFIDLLARENKNLCVVGDDDQSIYKFRGADIHNILDFEKSFPNAKIVKLEQNYRSTGNILKGANSVIAKNSQRKSKTLWTASQDGHPIVKRVFQTAYDEARSIVRDISKKAVSQRYNQFAILYRTNAQSRLFEEQLVYNNIPYRIVGGVNFYSRKEIKDILAYLKTIDNGYDELAIKRIINIPKRGIGSKSLERISDYAALNDITFFEACCRAEAVPGIGKAAAKITKFTEFIKKNKSLSSELNLVDFIKKLLDDTQYIEMLKSDGSEESLERITNIGELLTKAESYADSTENPSLSGFLQDVALVADIDSLDDNADRVFLMTCHSAKGLEFDNVYLVGMENGLFPSFTSLFDSDDTELEEERRLFYVGMTRARRTLTLTAAKMRMIRGEAEFHKESVFLEEIDSECMEDKSDWEMRENRKQSSYDEQTELKAPIKKVQETKPYAKVIDLNAFKPVKPQGLDYAEGDTVNHKKFGIGRVLQIKETPKDFEVTVEFDKYGIKRMFAAFAKLTKVQ